MRAVMTKDGSMTFYSEAYKETYHSVSGAIEESFRKFAEPSGAGQKALSGNVRILDICFGLGYNSLAALHTARMANPDCMVEITALDKDIEILRKLKGVAVFAELKQDYALLQRLAEESLRFKKRVTKSNVSFQILLGDASETIKGINARFDVVFLDPFSPRKNPELWTVDFLEQVFRLMKPGAALTTYSCASVVRKNLKAAGLTVKDGPCVGRKSPSTVALKSAPL